MRNLKYFILILVLITGAIINLMKSNLELEEKEMIKTFSFDANEDYNTKVTGQGIFTGSKLETMPNFVGLNVSQAETWASNNNVTLKTLFVDNTSPYYNPNINAGMIANQSYAYGLLLKNLSELTIYINDSSIINDNQNDSNINEEDNIPSEGSNEDSEDINNEMDILPDVVLPSEEDSDQNDLDEEELNIENTNQ